MNSDSEEYPFDSFEDDLDRVIAEAENYIEEEDEDIATPPPPKKRKVQEKENGKPTRNGAKATRTKQQTPPKKAQKGKVAAKGRAESPSEFDDVLKGLINEEGRY
jgi:hypothetical protein